ncbi:MAG: hypothetical protein ACYDBV_01835 [Nitrospiria bacterium]
MIFIIIILLATETKALNGQWLTLGSGKRVEILAVGPLKSAKGWSSLMLKYRTSISVDDVALLRKESNEIWERFVVDVEQAGYNSAIISANEPEKGEGIKHNRGFNFVFEKKDGSWRTYEDKGQVKLDEKFVRGIIDRCDWAYDHNEMNAILLYLGNNWTLTLTKSSEGTSSSQTIDRMKFAEGTRQFLLATKDFHHERKVLRVTINEGGNSAEVESREIEEGVINGKNTKMIEHSIDLLEIRDHVVTITKSTVTYEKNEKI